MMASYKYFALGYKKPYQLFEFERIFLKSKGNQAKLLKMKAEQAVEYYESVLTFFNRRYPGCYFRFSVQLNDNYEPKQRNLQQKMAKALKRAVFKVMRLSTGLQAKSSVGEIAKHSGRTDGKYLCSLDVEFWQHSSLAWTYFVYMNPVFVA